MGLTHESLILPYILVGDFVLGGILSREICPRGFCPGAILVKAEI